MKSKLKNIFLFYPKWLLLCVSYCISFSAISQDVNSLLKNLKAKLDKVNDYTAEGRMKTDVPFIKAPAGNVKIFYKRPDKFKLKRSNGISLLPKGGLSANMGRLLDNGNYLAIAAGESVIGGVKLKIIKLLPINENSDVILNTLYIDEAKLLIIKTSTTTKDNGSYEMEMSYGEYAEYGLPDKIIFYFNTKDFKLPKGITMEFDDGEKKTATDKTKSKQGSIEISYASYVINKGVPDAAFK